MIERAAHNYAMHLATSISSYPVQEVLIIKEHIHGSRARTRSSQDRRARESTHAESEAAWSASSSSIAMDHGPFDQTEFSRGSIRRRRRSSKFIMRTTPPGFSFFFLKTRSD
jgi:hypothetical protein